MVKNIVSIESAINFIEKNLNGKISLETVAERNCYSKYYLHRIFADVTGITIHNYILRRQLTEGAGLLTFSKKPIIEIAFMCGYESQQAFSTAFKSMYKMSPAEYRKRQEFYPLQLKILLHKKLNLNISKKDIRFAEAVDIPDWMKFVDLIVDGFPHLDKSDYLQKLKSAIGKRQALVLKQKRAILGAVIFSSKRSSIEFMGVHPQYRSCGIQKLFLEKLMEEYLFGESVSITTYREKDKADTGYRNELIQLGFVEGELLTEFGYPTQRFIFYRRGHTLNGEDRTA